MTGNKKNTYWNRTEGKVGMAIIVIIAVALIYLLYSLTPGVLAGEVFPITGLIIILGLILLFLFDRKLRLLGELTVKQISKAITSWFIDVDPMKILHKRIKEMEDNLRHLKRQLVVLKGQSHKLMEQILNNEKEIERHLTYASKARKAREETNVIINTRKAARLRGSNENLAGLLQKIKNLRRVLERMKNNSTILLADVKDQIEIKDKEREAILAGNTAMKSAMEILNGGEYKMREWDAALEAVADDVAQKAGEMEEFMRMSKSMMNNIDLQKGVFQNEGEDMLAKFEEKNRKFSEGMQLDDGNQRNELELDDELPEKEKSDNYYDSLFNINDKKDGQTTE